MWPQTVTKGVTSPPLALNPDRHPLARYDNNVIALETGSESRHQSEDDISLSIKVTSVIIINRTCDEIVFFFFFFSDLILGLFTRNAINELFRRDK